MKQVKSNRLLIGEKRKHLVEDVVVRLDVLSIEFEGGDGSNAPILLLLVAILPRESLRGRPGTDGYDPIHLGTALIRYT